MTITKHEIRQGFRQLLIWTAAIASFMIICILIFPEMKGEMSGMGAMFSSMGAFTKAFGLDVLDFGTLRGYYAIECGNVIGIGGALFAALISVNILSKEEGGHTAEFLFAHPVSRSAAAAQKAIALFLQLAIMNAVVFALSAASVAMIGEGVFRKELALMHLAYFLVQLEIASICFLISALIRTSGMGIGLGIAVALYFINLIANITETMRALKYLTPFAFAEASDILKTGEIEPKFLLPGMCVSFICVIAAFFVYRRKDLR